MAGASEADAVSAGGFAVQPQGLACVPAALEDGVTAAPALLRD